MILFSSRSIADAIFGQTAQGSPGLGYVLLPFHLVGFEALVGDRHGNQLWVLLFMIREAFPARTSYCEWDAILIHIIESTQIK
jgi:hypothetical protein